MGKAPFERRWVWWTVLFGFWTLPGLLTATQLYVSYRYEGRAMPFARHLWQMPAWYFWAAATPLVIWLGRRFRIDRRRWLRGVAQHVPFAVLVTLLHLTAMTCVAWWFSPYPVEEWGVASVFTMLAMRYIHMDLLTYIALLGLGYAFDYYRRMREGELKASRLRAQLVQAQLQALKMQLHPHFLFNTLNAISSMVRNRANREAVRMLAGLSDLLRLALENQGAQVVSLRQELEFLERYLELERIRFQDRLDVRLAIAPDTLAAQIPNLILQPLVENAIRHGIAARADAGLLELRTWREADELLVSIRDDGPGVRPNGTREGGGVGLTNTRARLEQLYGRAFRLELRDAHGGGAQALLAIPFNAEPVEVSA